MFLGVICEAFYKIVLLEESAYISIVFALFELSAVSVDEIVGKSDHLTIKYYLFKIRGIP